MGVSISEYTYGKRSLEDVKRSLLTLVMLVLSLVGVFWLSVQGVQAGTVYILLFLYGLSSLFLLSFYTKSSTASYEVPISARTFDSVAFFVIGIFIPLGLFLIPKLLQLKSIFTPAAFVPLTFSTGVGSAQTFSAITTIADPFWKAFVIVFTAGTIEPFAVGFASVAFGVILGKFIRSMLSGLDFGKAGNKYFDFFIAMVYSIIFFVLIHRLNDSYVTVAMFVFAGMFRFIMNVSLYYVNLSFSFLFGFHQMNNALAIGLKDTFNGFLSNTFGWLILFIYFIIFIHFIINIKKFPDTLRRLWREVKL